MVDFDRDIPTPDNKYSYDKTSKMQYLAVVLVIVVLIVLVYSYSKKDKPNNPVSVTSTPVSVDSSSLE